jgi:tetratricopeptide (TPR) repeat protein
MARSCRCFGLVACLLLGVPLLQAAAQQTNDFTDGVRLYNDGEYTNAATALGKATQATPNLEPAWYYLGMAKFRLGDYPGALAALEQARGLAGARPGTRLVVGQLYETQAAYDQAVQVYQEELRLRHGTDVVPVLAAIGRASYLGGQADSAIAALQKVTTENPRHVEALYYLGLAEHSRGRYERAAKAFESALRTMEEWQTVKRQRDRLTAESTAGTLTTQQQRELGEAGEKLAQDYGPAQDFGTELRLWPALNKALGDTYLAQEEYSAARSAYRKALEKEQLGDPSDPDVHTRVARAYLADAKAAFTQRGMLLEAVGVLDQAIASAKTAQTLNAAFAPARTAMGEVYLFQAKTYITHADLGITSHTCEEALAEFQAALKIAPNNLNALGNAAECLLWLDRPAEARDLLNKALTLDPKRDDLHAQMAQVLLAEEDATAALKEAQTALVLKKTNVDALNVAGRIYMYYREDLGEAIQHFSDAATADPRRWETFANLGLAFFQMESWYRARSEFQKALGLIPTATIANTAQQQAYLYYLIARTYHQTGMYDREVEALNEALGRFPQHLGTLKQLALAYEAQKKFRAAQQVLGDALALCETSQDDADVHIQLGGMLEREGLSHEAVAAYAAALRADPNSLAAQQALDRLQTR